MTRRNFGIATMLVVGMLIGAGTMAALTYVVIYAVDHDWYGRIFH